MRTVVLTGSQLTSFDVMAIARSEATVRISEAALERVRVARRTVDGILERGETVYGINTGFGALVNTTIGPDDVERLQVNLIRSHATALGEPLSIVRTRAMMVVRLNSLVKGHSGVHEDPLHLMVELLNAGITPVVPHLGSLGASGDLAPLSHMALVLIGEGEVWHNGVPVPSTDVLNDAGLTPIRLRAKDGLSLINGTSLMSSLLAEADVLLHDVLPMADLILCGALEARRCSIRPFDPRIHAVRPHPGQRKVAARVTRWMEQSANVADHEDCDRVQDPYSFRCAAQVHGVTSERFDALSTTVRVELNAVTDNPLIFPDPVSPGPHEVISQGNFHGEILGQTADAMALALFEQASMSERRMDQMLDPARSGGRAFLARSSGLESGLMIVHYVAGAALSEMHGSVLPRSAFSTVTSGGQEDHVSMGATACFNLLRVLDRFVDVLACEALIACEAMEDLPVQPSQAVQTLHKQVRSVAEPLTEDRSTSGELESIGAALRTGSWHALVQSLHPEP
jgi:histidine ammonia-lyase